MPLSRPALGTIVPGDIVTRQMGHDGPTMQLRVSAVDDDLIHCGDWTFDLVYGVEVDHDLGWGPQYGKTGSVLVAVERPEVSDAADD